MSKTGDLVIENLNCSANELLHKTSKGDVCGGDPAGNKKVM